MSNTIVHLVAKPAKPNESVLAMMRDIMAKVESGEIVSAVFVGVTTDRRIIEGIGGESTPFLMLGGLQCMISKVQKWWVAE